MLRIVVKGIGMGIVLTGGIGAVYMYANQMLSDPIFEESELAPMAIFAKHCYAADMNNKFMEEGFDIFEEATGHHHKETVNIYFERSDLLQNRRMNRIAIGFIIESEEDYRKIMKYIEEKKDKTLTLTDLPRTKWVKKTFKLSSERASNEYNTYSKKLDDYRTSTKKDSIWLRMTRYHEEGTSVTEGLIEDTRGPFDFSPLPHPIKK